MASSFLVLSPKNLDYLDIVNFMPIIAISDYCSLDKIKKRNRIEYWLITIIFYTNATRDPRTLWHFQKEYLPSTSWWIGVAVDHIQLISRFSIFKFMRIGIYHFHSYHFYSICGTKPVFLVAYKIHDCHCQWYWSYSYLVGFIPTVYGTALRITLPYVVCKSGLAAQE